MPSPLIRTVTLIGGPFDGETTITAENVNTIRRPVSHASIIIDDDLGAIMDPTQWHCYVDVGDNRFIYQDSRND